MADLHTEFSTYHDRIYPNESKRSSLKKSRDAIRERIQQYFRKELSIKVPKFRGQGSYAMGTTVNPLNGEYDIDDGVYLQHLDEHDDSEWPTPETVHRWLINATDGQTNERPIDKQTCVRVRYAWQYHVDLPSYSILNGKYLLAVKGDKGWHQSDPKAITDWFTDRVKENGQQLRKIVRYLKAWADFQSGKRGKMPSGIILSVLAARNFKADDRDDVSFSKTAKAIKDSVQPFFFVFNPVDPTEELTDRLSDVQKKRFQDAVSELATDSAKAVELDNSEKASRLWRQQLGDRFPKVQTDEDQEKKAENAVKLATIYGAKKPPKPWSY